ncbi:LysR family transcriptional regulator [Pseudooceanicola nanhaiensis]|uniref:LysR family transcriptional regulator n=1 Tax=Pseudooceanicola nanhaiensis TaxID=375761 RepID=UPI001CD7996C|nr:LysR family transcriptional regulator [Pseudooceanicola nanhaiensis]MCA0919283.1 LysR family transcriptional regulator [Pseudooceanicola nanhaiensis]
MDRDMIGDLSILLAVADEGNFTRAGHRLGVSQSAVSHTIRRLEDRIGVKLLNRNSRSVTLTDAGERLIATLRPSFRQVSDRIEEVRTLGERPSGLIRVTVSKPAAQRILWPVASQLVRDFPEVTIEISTDGRLSDLAEDRFDCAIRLSEHLGPDMIAVPVGPPLEMAAFASPDYLKDHPLPEHPEDLIGHNCIVMRHRVDGGTYDWEFEKDGEERVIKLDGPFILNDSGMVLQAALEGHGIGFLTAPEIEEAVAAGRLRRLLADWCPPFEGYHLCYSGRRNVSSALRVLIDRLRYRG